MRGTSAYAFFAESMLAFGQCCERHACAGVYVKTGVVNISVHICLHDRYRMCICAHVCAIYLLSVGKRGWGVSASL